MQFVEISCGVEEAACESVETALADLGAESLTLEAGSDEELLEPGPGETPLWGDLRLRALFFTDESPTGLLERLSTTVGTMAARDWSVRVVANQEWERAWMDHYHPMRFGSRLWICPSHRRIDDPQAVVVRLDPGLAFGTGTHPTTALCLDWLAGQDLATASVVDYGCGSGILAVAALMLGAERALAVDNDPQALIATRDNARRNGVDARLQVCAPLDAPVAQADVLVANILSGVVIELAPILIGQVRRGGRLALSGILERQAGEVQRAYAADCPLEILSARDGWVLLGGTVTR
jgi:ribosomal protein L11 methyltransferase